MASYFTKCIGRLLSRPKDLQPSSRLEVLNDILRRLFKCAIPDPEYALALLRVIAHQLDNLCGIVRLRFSDRDLVRVRTRCIDWGAKVSCVQM